MTQSEASNLIYGIALNDYDNHETRLPFDEANERRGAIDERLAEAIEFLGEDEAAELYDEEFDQIAELEG